MPAQKQPLQINPTRLNRLFIELASIDAPSFAERQAADAVIWFLNNLGLTVAEDDTAAKIGGNCGNLLCRVPGDGSQAPLLLSTHIDTVEPCRGKKISLGSDGIFRSDGTTILGADDYAGVTAILEAVRLLTEENVTHRPLELLFSVAEEAHLQGISHFDTRQLKAREGYVLDTSGAPGKGIVAAPGHRHFEFEIKGRAAHAGIAPESGISAIAAAADGISKLHWGRIDAETTANIGEITGGGATNIVAKHCHVTAECRSLDADKLDLISAQIASAMQEACDQSGAFLTTSVRTSYLPYQVAEGEAVAARFRFACQAVELVPKLETTGGGSDLNILAQAGIRGMVLSCGMQQVHSNQEYLAAPDLHQLTRLVLALIQSDC